MSEHTPGPWISELDAKSGNVNVLGLRRDGYEPRGSDGRGPILTVDCGDDEFSPFPDLREECLANARLIAAAPETAAERDHLKAVNADMMEALEPFALTARCQRVESPEWNDNDFVCLHISIGDLRRARAAISKATGGGL